MRLRHGLLTLLWGGWLAACHDSATAPAPPPTPGPTPSATPSSVAVPTAHQGPTQITLVSANIPPGTAVQGCGSRIGGCAGRLRMTFRLESSSGGPALWTRAFLHATNQQACLLASTDGFAIPAGQPLLVEMVFDQSDACLTPVTIANMAAVVEGPVEVASRQEWAVSYTFLP